MGVGSRFRQFDSLDDFRSSAGEGLALVRAYGWSLSFSLQIKNNNVEGRLS
jgi:hypothetical protein